MNNISNAFIFEDKVEFEQEKTKIPIPIGSFVYLNSTRKTYCVDIYYQLIETIDTHPKLSEITIGERFLIDSDVVLNIYVINCEQEYNIWNCISCICISSTDEYNIGKVYTFNEDSYVTKIY